MTLILNNEEITQVLTMDICMEVLEEAFQEQAAGRVINQLRYDVNMPLPSRSERQARYEFKTMVGVIPKLGVAALRMSSILYHRPVRDGLEKVEHLNIAPGNGTVGLVQLYSTETGELLSFMPDKVIDGMRVGGTFGLACKYLARKNACVLGLLGSGWQARFQLLAISHVRALKLVKVYSPNPVHCKKFAEDFKGKLGVEIVAVKNVEEVANGADILIAATNARSPIIHEEMISPGMYVAAVQNEISSDALRKADRIVVFSSKQSLVYEGGGDQYGRLVSNRSSLDYDKCPLLEQIIARTTQGRIRDDEITMFRSGSGMGVQFAAVAAKVYELAREQGLGHEIPTQWFTQTSLS